MTTAPHVGMKFWQFDPNRRRYKRDANGRAVGGPIWREHWVPAYIVGETKVSWLIGPQWMVNNPGTYLRASKIKKRDWPAGFALDEAELDRRAWIQEHRHEIAEAVRLCESYNTLKSIAVAVGYRAP